MGGTIIINENPVSLFFIVSNIHHAIFRMNHKKDVMVGEWKVFGPNGKISYTISNISVMSDDDNFWHNQLDTDDIYVIDDNYWTERFDKNSNIYIGLWSEYNSQSEQTNSYWCIFSDNFEQCSFKIVKSK